MKTSLSNNQRPDERMPLGKTRILTREDTSSTTSPTEQHAQSEFLLKARADAVTPLLDQILHRASGAPRSVCQHDVK